MLEKEGIAGARPPPGFLSFFGFLQTSHTAGAGGVRVWGSLPISAPGAARAHTIPNPNPNPNPNPTIPAAETVHRLPRAVFDPESLSIGLGLGLRLG